MKKKLKKLLLIASVFVIGLMLIGCGKNENGGNEPNNVNKTYSFPKADFIPSGMEYKGSGKIEWSSKNESNDSKHADAYVSNATIEDVIAYVQDLKSNGLHKANDYVEEQDGFDEYGSYSWVGVNDANDFSISVSLTDTSTKLNFVDASYNLLITMSNQNPYE